MFQKEILFTLSVVYIYLGVTTQIIIVRTSLQINFHSSNQHDGMLVSELQTPLIVFGNVKFRMWGDKECLQISREETSWLPLLQMLTDTINLWPLIITAMLHAGNPTNSQWNAHAYELRLYLGLHFCFCQFSFMLHTVLHLDLQSTFINYCIFLYPLWQIWGKLKVIMIVGKERVKQFQLIQFICPYNSNKWSAGTIQIYIIYIPLLVTCLLSFCLCS